MKKFITFVLAALVIFAMCSCQPVQEVGGIVPFRLSIGEAASKAIEATDVGKDAIKRVQLKFTPVNQGMVTVAGESEKWEDDLVIYESTTGKGTWDGDDRYMSQGQWKIEARALDTMDEVDEDGIGVADNKNHILFYGFVNVYISKTVNRATVTMTPYESEETGTFSIAALKSNAVFAPADKAYHRIKYTVYDIAGTPVTGMSGYILPDSVTSDVVTYKAVASQELEQGSYYITTQLEQQSYTVGTDGTRTLGDWVTATGGSAIDFMVIAGKDTVISGNISTSDYIKAQYDTIVDIDSEITLSIAYSSTDGKYTATAKLPVGSTKAVDKYIWFVDGALQDSTTAALTVSALPYGTHEIRCWAADTTNKIKSNMTSSTLQATLTDGVWKWSAN